MRILTRTFLPFFLSFLLVVSAVPIAAQDYESPEAEEIHDLVDRAALLVDRDRYAACAAFKRPNSDWRYEDVYVFILDIERGEMLCHPQRPNLEGESVADLRDPDGRRILDLMLEQVQGERTSGWLHYLWPRGASGVLAWKSSRVRRVDVGEQALLVGAGAYGLPRERAFTVERVEDAARRIEKDGAAAFEALRDPSGGFLFLDTYVFVMSADGVMLVHPEQPDLEGQGVLDVRDPEGIYPGREMLKVVEDADDGWVGYFWPLPGSERLAPKETYVRKVTGMGEAGDETWILGAGVYLER